MPDECMIITCREQGTVAYRGGAWMCSEHNHRWEQEVFERLFKWVHETEQQELQDLQYSRVLVRTRAAGNPTQNEGGKDD